MRSELEELMRVKNLKLETSGITCVILTQSENIIFYEKEERIEPTEEIISSFIKKIRDEVKTYVK